MARPQTARLKQYFKQTLQMAQRQNPHQKSKDNGRQKQTNTISQNHGHQGKRFSKPEATKIITQEGYAQWLKPKPTLQPN
jgi:hypothetical protein